MMDEAIMNGEIRITLKAQLLSQIEALGRQNALFPAEGTAIDHLIEQLEHYNPTLHPLHPDAQPQLLGHWQLIYASRGTVVTRRLTPFVSGLGETGITLEQVWQTLSLNSSGVIAAENGADLNLLCLGNWRLRAEGTWDWQNQEEPVVMVSFDALAVQARQVLGQPQWHLPEFKIPVLDFVRSQAWWKTSYLDTELRVGRGATGNLFVFRKSTANTNDKRNNDGRNNDRSK